jgi:maltose alpha-D-glucosyltransferase/alpha-amylase
MTTPERVLGGLGAALRPDQLADRRWVRSKHRTVVDVEPYDALPLDGLGRWLGVVEVHYHDGASERYALPVVVEGTDVREAEEADRAWHAIARLSLAGGRQPGARGVLSFSPTEAGLRLVEQPEQEHALAELPERRIGVEQSNTSAVLGSQLIVKLYRLLEPGQNPEVEMGTFLTDAGFEASPPVYGSVAWADGSGGTCAVAMTQAFVANEGDGWKWLLRELASGGGDGLLDEIASIGRLTTSLHAALASRPAEPAFPARFATTAERAAWRRSAEHVLEQARTSLAGASAERLARIAPVISERLAAIDARGPARVSRIHGDYHLGQLLRVRDGFVVVDFEGEPARPLWERRRPSSPLRDVAGMLRSLDYAARTAERSGQPSRFDAEGWLREARAAFLGARDPSTAGPDALLAGFELEKACYELVYEARNRPGWTWLPLDALERLAA